MNYLDGERQAEIIHEVCNEYNVPLHKRDRIRYTVFLGKGPSASPRNVNRRLEEDGLDPLDEFLEQGLESKG